MSLFKKREDTTFLEVKCPDCGHLNRMEKHTLSAYCKRCMCRIDISVFNGASKNNSAKSPVRIKQQEDLKSITCPKCGLKNNVPEGALSVFCRKCGDIISINKKNTVQKNNSPAKTGNKTRTVRCYTCQNMQSVPQNAMSAFCSGCGNRIELADFRIKDKCVDKVVTRGDLHVLSSGILRADADASNARIDGEVFGNLHVEDKLVIGSKGKVYGNITAKRMELEKGAFYRGTVRLNADSNGFQEEKREELAKTAGSNSGF